MLAAAAGLLHFPAADIRRAVHQALSIPRTVGGFDVPLKSLEAVEALLSALRSAGETLACEWDASLPLDEPLPR